VKGDDTVLTRLRRDGEEGIVMVTVLLVSMVMLLIVSGSIAYSLGSQPISKHDQDWNAALAAAQAGLDDYLYRLNANDQYYLYSSSNAPPDGNQAFSHWVDVPDSGSAGQFRYAADTTYLAAQGAIILTSTGRAGHATRTIQATVRRHAFIDYLYFTDYETTDPAAYPTASNSNNSAWAQTNCALHFYESRDSTCTDINFLPGDVINGPLHTNDAMLICGTPTFSAAVETSWTGSGGTLWRNNPSGSCGGNPSFLTGYPKYADPLTMPPNNVAIRADADKSEFGTGCLFTGPTSITLNAAGTMTVVSPFTKTTATTTNNCTGGTLASPSTQALPANGVVYVQNVPSSASDPNYSASCITSTQLSSGSTTSAAVVQHPLGYPQVNDITPYGCMNGDVFIKGTLKGRLTVAADNNIDIIGNLSYQGGSGGSDLLGLIANNYVEVYHPVDSSNSSSGQTYCDGSYISSNGTYYCNLKLPGAATAFDNPVINAAILAVAHSFRVQNYALGEDNPLGTLTIYGAIAQKYRGLVSILGTSGYVKSYSYDSRLKYQSPPRFLSPVAASWQIVTWIEQAPAYAWSAP
jgi:hypothetical protein